LFCPFIPLFLQLRQKSSKTRVLSRLCNKGHISLNHYWCDQNIELGLNHKLRILLLDEHLLKKLLSDWIGKDSTLPGEVKELAIYWDTKDMLL
jgi:hypothetical protein